MNIFSQIQLLVRLLLHAIVTGFNVSQRVVHNAGACSTFIHDIRATVWWRSEYYFFENDIAPAGEDVCDGCTERQTLDTYLTIFPTSLFSFTLHTSFQRFISRLHLRYMSILTLYTPLPTAMIRIAGTDRARVLRKRSAYRGASQFHTCHHPPITKGQTKSMEGMEYYYFSDFCES